MAFKGFDNVETFEVSKDGSPYDLAGAGFTSARVYADDCYVEGTIATTEVSAVLGDLKVAVGEYEGKVVVYSPVYPDGLVIVGPGLPETLQITMKG